MKGGAEVEYGNKNCVGRKTQNSIRNFDSILKSNKSYLIIASKEAICQMPIFITLNLNIQFNMQIGNIRCLIDILN